MPINRYFIDLPLTKEEAVFLEGDEAYHLISVTRIKVGEIVELVNGKNQLAHAEVIEIKKKEALLKIQKVETTSPPQHQFILAQAIPRLNRLDTILEKGTELGMSAIWLFPGQRSEKKEINEERSKKIIINAMKQCGRLDLPPIVLKPPLEKWQKQEIVNKPYFGDLSANAPSFSTVKENQIIFFIGPESGFAENEIEILKGFQAKGVKLHPNILRTDTASLVALSIFFVKF